MIQYFPDCPGFIGFDHWEDLEFFRGFMADKNYAALLALLPAIIQFSEDIHGAKSGKKKLGTSVALAQSALLTAAAAGLVDPVIATNTVAITDSVESTLLKMKRKGTIKEVGKSEIQS